MNNTKPSEMISDFLQTIFLLVVISFFVFYFIVEGNWNAAEEITRVASSLALFGAAFLFKLKKISIEIKEKKEGESFDEIFAYFNRADKIKSLSGISLLLLIILIANYFFGIDAITEISQFILTFIILYLWHLYLFRKRDSNVLRMYANFLDKSIDSILIYFIPVMILIISWKFNSYSYVDIVNAIFAIIILHLRHKLIFDLNDKK